MEYTITIKFSADRELTQDELDTLEYVLVPQVEEPVIHGDHELVDAEYSTSEISYEIKQNA